MNKRDSKTNEEKVDKDIPNIESISISHDIIEAGGDIIIKAKSG